MLDAFGAPPQFRGDLRVFQATGSSAFNGYQAWTKPPSATKVMMVCIAGGGGGGAGFTRTAGNPGGGGGGGSCSGIAHFSCPATFLPDTMYVQVGTGGTGGVAAVSAGAGGGGNNSYILTGVSLASAIPVLPNIICYSGVTVPGGGGGGAVGAAGAAGGLPTVAVTQPFNTLGEWAAIVGLAGVAGGAQTGAAGASVTAWAALPLSPGAGGGGIATTTNFTGGSISSTNLCDFNNQHFIAGVIVPVGATAGGDGGAGISITQPFFQTGGSGGGTNNSGVGGQGGEGGIGCGGGGGGAGTTGGMGGNGGPGLVVIISW